MSEKVTVKEKLKISGKNFVTKLIVSVCIITGGAFGLSFIMPDLSAKSLVVISAIILVFLYVFFKMASFFFKLALIIIIIALIAMYAR